MEYNTLVPKIDLFSTFSLASNILPYLGKYSLWRYLMLSLTKNSNELWNDEKSKKSFINLLAITKWRNEVPEFRKFMNELLLENIDAKEAAIAKQQNGILNETDKNNFSVLLDCSKRSNIAFIQCTKEMQIPKVNRFVCDNINLLSKAELSDFNLFLSFLFSKTEIPCFKLRFNDMMMLNNISFGLNHLLPYAVNEVLLDQFVLTDSTLKLVIEGSKSCNKLTLSNCIIFSSDSFELNTELEYMISQLSLEYSIINSNIEAMKQLGLGYSWRK